MVGAHARIPSISPSHIPGVKGMYKGAGGGGGDWSSKVRHNRQLELVYCPMKEDTAKSGPMRIYAISYGCTSSFIPYRHLLLSGMGIVQEQIGVGDGSETCTCGSTRDETFVSCKVRNGIVAWDVKCQQIQY